MSDTVKDDPTCAASGAGCHFVYMKRFRSWGCQYCGRDATEAETLELSMPTFEGQPIKQPLTLDDVSKRIDRICNEYMEQAKRVKATYDTALEVLAAEIEASPDLDQDAVGSLVFGRVKKMLTTASEVFG